MQRSGKVAKTLDLNVPLKGEVEDATVWVRGNDNPRILTSLSRNVVVLLAVFLLEQLVTDKLGQIACTGFNRYRFGTVFPTSCRLEGTSSRAKRRRVVG